MTLEEAQAILDKWIAADGAISKGQSYSVDGLSLTRVDASMITEKINFWQKKVNEIVDQDSGRQPGVALASFR